ncbi:5-formyltetrahydrofolate cyclo-ligase [Methylophilaceae bacterium]|nr:5-formyltetrahydrofolate cyclo-ligase [Methylophilaceae bacterium]
MKKDIVRKTYLKKRRELSSSKFEEESSQLVQNTIELIKKYKPECIHCFLPIHSKDEINTTPIIQYCWENNINVVVPVSNFEDGTLKNAEFRPHTKTKQTKNNITEPIDPIWIGNNSINLVITPLLAFDCNGYRVGYGKGFYDRFFASLPKEVKRVGISLFDPCTEIVDISTHDIPLTHCVTPNKTYAF